LDDFRPEPIPREKHEKKAAQSGCVGFAIDTIETILIALALFFGINAVSDRVRVENVSMQPTLYSGEFVLVNKLAYKIGSPHIGDIIIFPYPNDPVEKYVKRVIGLPGDTVEVSDGVVYVNGQALTEPYIADQPVYSGTWLVPEGELFVLGDNRNNSTDSHVWGFVKIDQVIGKALVIYWPLDKLKILDHPQVVQASP
jgi:signal peptidase I